jgi:hypothetical protein
MGKIPGKGRCKMKFNKAWKIILGVLTAWVALYPFLMMLFMFPFFFFTATLDSRSAEMPTGFLTFLFIFFFFAMITAFLQMGMSILYLALIIKNKDVSDILRIVLGVGVFYMPFIAMPVSYFVFLWPESTPAGAMEKSGEAKN